MPAVTGNFLSAMNGTTHDETNDAAVTNPASGLRSLKVDIIDERFVTNGIGLYSIGPVAHGVLSAVGAQPAPAGNGVVVGGVTYAVTIDVANSYINVQQTSP